jgi:uncharacterized protein YjbI with pentapeptide repeats
MMERTEFNHCDLSNMMLFASRQKDLTLNGCKLNRSEINATSLAGVDLSDCEMESLITQGENLRGAIISADQAPFLIPLFGIHVKL